ncbi:MAG: NUDIX domain-containing protein [Parcubacteria group bacterium]|jgi:8-oxo-dGTP diphosphatase
MESKRQLSVVIALIRNAKGKILLQRRVDPLIPSADGKWEFPGGRIDYGESPEEAIKRECMEEIGCEIEIVRLIPCVQSTIWPRSDGDSQHVLVFCYKAKLKKGTPVPGDKKVSEVKWFSNEEINTVDTLSGIKEFVKLSKK